MGDAVVFDFDGTLFDTVPLIVASHRHALQTVLGRDEPDAVLRAGIGRPLMEQMRVFDADRADDLLAAYQAWNREATPRYVRWFPHLPEMLVRLHGAGIAVAIATSKMRIAIDLAFSLHPPPIAFDAVVTLEDSDRHKPDPLPILTAIERCGSTPARAVYVGDATVDVLAARAAAAGAVAVTWGAGERAALAALEPDALCDDPASLAEACLDVLSSRPAAVGGGGSAA
jgi:pyrophosphatase PpaX